MIKNFNIFLQEGMKFDIETDKKMDKLKNCPLIKNLQFLSYHHETWSRWQKYEVVLLTKFHDDSQKIVDFSFVDNFDLVWFFFLISLSSNAIKGKKLSSNFKLSDIIFQRLLDFRPKLKMTLISLIMISYFIFFINFCQKQWIRNLSQKDIYDLFGRGW